jgi:hypothetical protein
LWLVASGWQSEGADSPTIWQRQEQHLFFALRGRSLTIVAISSAEMDGGGIARMPILDKDKMSHAPLRQAGRVRLHQ